jgi:hypothetical protein
MFHFNQENEYPRHMVASFQEIDDSLAGKALLPALVPSKIL